MSINPAHRPSLEEVVSHPWMQGGRPSREEIRVDFVRRKTAVDAEAHNERESKRNQRAQAQNNERTVKRSGTHEEEEGESAENMKDIWRNLEVAEYGPCFI